MASRHTLAFGDGVSRQDRQDLGCRRAGGDAVGQDGEPEAEAGGDGADAQAYPYTHIACSGEGPLVAVAVAVGVSLWSTVLVCCFG